MKQSNTFLKLCLVKACSTIYTPKHNLKSPSRGLFVMFHNAYHLQNKQATSRLRTSVWNMKYSAGKWQNSLRKNLFKQPRTST